VKLLGTPGVAGAGYLDISGQDTNAFLGLDLYMQVIITDPAGVRGRSLTNALKMSVSY
jgi:hypothetical protein